MYNNTTFQWTVTNVHRVLPISHSITASIICLSLPISILLCFHIHATKNDYPYKTLDSVGLTVRYEVMESESVCIYDNIQYTH